MGCANSSSAADGCTVKGCPSTQGFHKLYKLGYPLGAGNFGQVRVAKCKRTDKLWAVKIIDLRHRDITGEVTHGVDKELLSYAKTEIDLWALSAGKCDNVVDLHQSFIDGNLCYMVMEKCKCSLLEKFEHAASEVVLHDCFKAMLHGISHVHTCGVVHRDIKAENFLVGEQNTLKLCDFGLAAALPKKGGLKGVFGTPPYMSPEMVSNQVYDGLTDVWSFGAVAYIMVFGRYPYTPDKMTAQKMKDAIRDDCPQIEYCEQKSDSVYSASQFVKALLQRSTSSRPSADAALELEFIKPKPAAALFFGGLDPAPALRKARKLTNQTTKDLTTPINPIVQRSLEALLEQLETEGKLEFDGHKLLYFSEATGEQEVSAKLTEDDRILSRSGLRKSTHSGVLSGTLSGNTSTSTTATAVTDRHAEPRTP